MLGSCLHPLPVLWPPAPMGSRRSWPGVILSVPFGSSATTVECLPRKAIAGATFTIFWAPWVCPLCVFPLHCGRHPSVSKTVAGEFHRVGVHNLAHSFQSSFTPEIVTCPPSPACQSPMSEWGHTDLCTTDHGGCVPTYHHLSPLPGKS